MGRFDSALPDASSLSEFFSFAPVQTYRLSINKATMDRQQRKADLIQFLCTIQRPDFSIEDIDDSQSLIESGLIDSLAMLQIVSYLEETYNIDFRERGVDPGELSSISAILDLIEHPAA
ncbi:MAG: acyl carrier protein [Candidatus Binatia bacterium]